MKSISTPVLLVTGMHRSGTSLLTRLLSETNCFALGCPTQYRRNAWNKDGYHEYQPFVQLNNKILAEQLCSWSTVLEFDTAKLSNNAKSHIATQMHSIIQQIVGESNAGNLPVLLKDPRCCLTFPVLNFSPRNCFVVELVRNPEAVAQSLDQRDRLNPLIGASLWEAYHASASQCLPDNRTVIAFEGLCADPAGTLANLGSKVAQFFAMDAKPIIESLKASADSVDSAKSVIPDRKDSYHLLLQDSYDAALKKSKFILSRTAHDALSVHQNFQRSQQTRVPIQSMQLAVKAAIDANPSKLPEFWLEKAAQQEPIFIVGSPRSGTSIITLALLEGAGIEGKAEGHVLPLLNKLLATVENYYQLRAKPAEIENVLLSSLKSEAVANFLKGYIAEFYSRSHTSTQWLDKTGDAVMLRTLPVLHQIWPKSKVIFAKRRGIENIASRLRKFPNLKFELHCERWAETMETWLNLRDELSQPWIEVDQNDIRTKPNDVASALGDLLLLSSQQVQSVQAIFENRRPQKTSQRLDHQPIGLEEVEWTEDEKTQFKSICGPMMQAFGYWY